jgi:STE24 endopeptidase
MQISVNVREDSDAHRSRATLAKRAVLLAVAAAAWVASGFLLWRTEVPHLQLADLDPRAYFGAPELERIADFRRISRLLLLGSLAVTALVLLVFVWKAGTVTDAVAGFAKGRIRTGILTAALAVVAVWLLLLPLAGVSHWWRRRYGLSEQGYGGWLRDEAMSLALQLILIVIAVVIFMGLATWLGRSWWLAGGPALVMAGVVLVLAQPLVIDPLFNRFEPLPDRALAQRIEALGRQEGVTVTSVEVADASRRTTAANAYVAGIGPTRRVVLYDTLLDGRFSEPEIVSVSAHELAHVGRRHLWKGLAWFALLVIPCVFVVAWAAERQGGMANPRSVPLALAVSLGLFLVTLPFVNAVSRRYEAEADWIALRSTGNAAAFVSLEQKLIRAGLGDPDPPGWVTFWTGTHPTAMKRIAMAEAYESRPGDSAGP